MQGSSRFKELKNKSRLNEPVHPDKLGFHVHALSSCTLACMRANLCNHRDAETHLFPCVYIVLSIHVHVPSFEMHHT